MKVRKQAPQFTASAYFNKQFKRISLSNYKDRYVVLFFYPLDFTFVCPTEIIQFSDRVEEFKSIGCDILGVSVDSQFSHMKYCKQTRSNGGLGEMQFPLISDLSQEISKKYGVIIDDSEDPDFGVAFRGTFIIDGKGILRHYSINDLPVGRNVDEILRLVQAFKFTDEHGEVCPAQWKPGQPTMVTNHADPKTQKYWNEEHIKQTK
ncbi:unnamed protein product [Paramecium sonneborni]|uniref:thioredoxin-dependent peroxiredoxin n=1 Tax=Paramecium sonneborni TaxID=65129 RepID=A0A8S1L0F7_9CILI|nr:unnamed protein product [Paramecium sonneborni]